MFNLRFLTIPLAIIGLTATAMAQGGGVLITVNEHGVGSIDGTISLAGLLVPDPGPGGLPSALTYNLLGPPSLVAGDLLIQETIGATQVLSDVIRFNPLGTGAPGYPASLVFYSDNGDGVDAIADTGFPTSSYTNVFSMLEVGPEGNNGVFYTPTAGQPGFIAGISVTYQIISDDEGTVQTPEPAASSLAGLALVSLAVKWRRNTSQLS